MAARDRVLASSGAYWVLRHLVRADRGFAIIARDHLRPPPGGSILDLGCGDGAVSDHVGSDVTYTGVDHNAKYIDAARRRHGGPGRTFVCADLDRLDELDLPGTHDVVSMIGVLHHLPDELAVEVLRSAGHLAGDGGRVVTVDPVFEPAQPAIARVLMALDRGRYVRHPAHYEALVRDAGLVASSTIRSDLNPFPYTHLVMELARTA